MHSSLTQPRATDCCRTRRLSEYVASLLALALLAGCSQPAVPTAQSIVVHEDLPKQIQLSATGTNADAVSYKVFSQPHIGTLDGIPPQLIYRPNRDAFGADSFSFAIVDKDGNESEPASININVLSINDFPVAQPLAVEVLENKSIHIAPQATDVDGSIEIFAIAEEPQNGSLSETAHGFTYTPHPNFNGNDSFDFVAIDNEDGRSEPATVSVSITPVNSAPWVRPLHISTREDVQHTIQMQGFDSDSTDLTYRIVVSPKYGTLSGDGASRTYTPQPNFHGQDSFQYAVSDDQGEGSSSALVSIDVEPVNDPPHATDQELLVQENGTLPIELTGKDSDGQVVAYEVVSHPRNGTLAGTGGMRIYTPRSDFYGADTFQFVVSDELGEKSQPATIFIEVEAKDDPPTVRSSRWTTSEDGSGVEIQLAGDESHGRSWEYQIVQEPRNGTLRGRGNHRIYVPNTNFSGNDWFEYVVVDEEGRRSETATAMIEVIERPDRPSIHLRRTFYRTTLGRDIDINVSVSDPDGDAEWFSISDQGKANGSFEPASQGPIRLLRHLEFEPTGKGTHTYRLRVEDGEGMSDTASLTIEVENAVPAFDAPNPRYDKSRGVVEFTLRVRDRDGIVRRVYIETIDGRTAKRIVVDEGGTMEVGESSPFSPSGACARTVNQQCHIRVTYTPDTIDGHSRRIRFYAEDDQGELSRKDFVRIETRALR